MHAKLGWKCCDKMDGELIVVIMPVGYKHHSKAVCKHCCHFIKWVHNPEMEAKLAKMKIVIEKLLTFVDKMDDYDRIFITDMTKKKSHTKKQLDYMGQLALKFLI